ncbi:hypothetical protein IWW50_006067, partial [Coemansia erecta]
IASPAAPALSEPEPCSSPATNPEPCSSPATNPEPCSSRPASVPSAIADPATALFTPVTAHSAASSAALPPPKALPVIPKSTARTQSQPQPQLDGSYSPVSAMAGPTVFSAPPGGDSDYEPSAAGMVEPSAPMLMEPTAPEFPTDWAASGAQSYTFPSSADYAPSAPEPMSPHNIMGFALPPPMTRQHYSQSAYGSIAPPSYQQPPPQLQNYSPAAFDKRPPALPEKPRPYHFDAPGLPDKPRPHHIEAPSLPEKPRPYQPDMLSLAGHPGVSAAAAAVLSPSAEYIMFSLHSLLCLIASCYYYPAPPASMLSLFSTRANRRGSKPDASQQPEPSLTIRKSSLPSAFSRRSKTTATENAEHAKTYHPFPPRIRSLALYPPSPDDSNTSFCPLQVEGDEEGEKEATEDEEQEKARLNAIADEYQNNSSSAALSREDSALPSRTSSLGAKPSGMPDDVKPLALSVVTGMKKLSHEDAEYADSPEPPLPQYSRNDSTSKDVDPVEALLEKERQREGKRKAALFELVDTE